MPKIDIKSIEGQIVGHIDLPESLFSLPYNPFPIQEVVRMQLANRRRGTHKTKQRGEIKASKKKHHRQKGTGFARAGSVKSPIRRGGGIVFGPQPRDYSYSPPKKVRKKALAIALSKKFSDGLMEVIREFEIETPKTKNMINHFDPELTEKKILVVLGDKQENLEKSLRNIPYVKTLQADGLNVYDILYHNRLILLEKSVPQIIKRLES